MSLWSQCYSLVSLTWGSSQDMLYPLFLGTDLSFVLVCFGFFFWIPVFEQFDQGSCFGTVMFETCPTSRIYKFLITISIVSLHMTVSSLTSWRINPVGFSLNLKKKKKKKKLAHFSACFPFLSSPSGMYFICKLCSLAAPAIKSDIFQHRYHIHL